MSFNLSDKSVPEHIIPLDDERVYYESDLKEFIKRLKHKIAVKISTYNPLYDEVCEVIDKLAGEKLI